MAKAKSNAKAKSGKDAKAKVLKHTLDWRDFDLPPNINFRTQKHGDDNVQAADIRVSGVPLSKAEFEDFAQERYASRGLWAAGGRGKPEKPTLLRFEPLKLSDTIESARVRIRVGGEEINLGVSKLKAVTFARNVVGSADGDAAMSCMVQSTPAINAKLATLIAGMDGKARIWIEYEHNAEQLEAFDGEAAKKGDAELDKLEKDVQAQIDGFNRGTPVGDSAVPETH